MGRTAVGSISSARSARTREPCVTTQNRAGAGAGRDCLACGGRGRQTRRSACGWARPQDGWRWRRRFAEHRMAGASRRDASLAHRASSAMTRPPRSSPDARGDAAGTTHWTLRSMAKAAGFAPSRSIASGRLSACSRIAPRLQAVHRPALRREIARYRRALSVAAQARHGPVRRREEPDPGARPHPAPSADEAGPDRATHARLCASRNPRLFAALDVPAGKVIGRCYRRHRDREFLSSCTRSRRNVPRQISTSTW